MIWRITKENCFEQICSSVIAATILTTPALAATDSINFPGPKSELKSPNGLYAIKNIDDPRFDRELVCQNYSSHLVFLKKGQKKQVPFKKYFRNVDILWSPDSSAFVLNDWIGSNVAESYLYRVTRLTQPIDIGSKLILTNENDKHSVAEAAKFGAVYTFVSRWKDPTSLEIKLAGHSIGRGFTLTYSWDLKNSYKLIKRESEENLTSD